MTSSLNSTALLKLRPQRPERSPPMNANSSPRTHKLSLRRQGSLRISRSPRAALLRRAHPSKARPPPRSPKSVAPNPPLGRARVGPLPQLPLEGSADPASVQQQRNHLRAGLEREHMTGQQNAAQPLGEDEIYPTVPAETLRAAVAQQPGANGHAAGAPEGADDDQAASIVAEQEKGGEIHGAVSVGLSSLANQRQDYAQRTTGERAKADAEMSQLERTNSQDQTGERAAAKREVLGVRRQWTD